MFACLCLVVSSCSGDDDTTEATSDPASTADVGGDASTSNPDSCVDGATGDLFPDKVVPEHTEQWNVEYMDTYKVVTVDAAYGSDTDPAFETYVLVQCGTDVPPLDGELDGAQVFTVPLERFVESGGGTYGALEQLDLADRVVGWRNPPSGLDLLPSLAARADDITDIGTYGEEDFETLVSLEADGLTSYGEPEFSERVRELGLPVFQYSPFSESPLGSAEQLKLISLFFNAEATANDRFDEIESAYEELVELVASAEDEPTVLIGNVSGDGNFSSRPEARIESLLVEAAGGERVLADEDLDFSGFQPTLSFETVVARAADVDFWFSMAYLPSEETSAEFIESDPNNGRIAAMERGDAFHRFARGEDYFATAAVNVDELLADLVSILHPELLPDHELVHLDRIEAEG